MSASRYESFDLGFTTVSAAGSDLGADLPSAAVRHLRLDDGDRVVYLIEEEGTVLAYHEEGAPKESQRLVGITTFQDGQTSIPVTSTALKLLDVSEGDRILAAYGPDGSVRLHRGSTAKPTDSPAEYRQDDSRTRDEIPTEHLDHVPDKIDWTDYAAYHCRFPQCNDPCLNRVDSPYSLTKTCRACYAETDVDDLDVRGDHLPEWAQGLDPSATSTTSEGEGEPARPAAQPERSSSRQSAQRSEQTAPTRGASGEQPEPDRERPERSAPARPAGSAPSRGDPEARAHPPNPQGEGAPHGDAHQTERNETTEQGSL